MKCIIIPEIWSSNNDVKNNILKRLSELGDRIYRLTSLVDVKIQMHAYRKARQIRCIII
jgi:hypothetical protein